MYKAKKGPNYFLGKMELLLYKSVLEPFQAERCYSPEYYRVLEEETFSHSIKSPRRTQTTAGGYSVDQEQSGEEHQHCGLNE